MEIERVMFTKDGTIITFTDGTTNEVSGENDFKKILEALEIELL